MKELLTYKEAAEMLGYSVNTLYSKVSRYEIPYFKTTSGRVMFDPAELREWQRHRHIKSKDDVKRIAEREML